MSDQSLAARLKELMDVATPGAWEPPLQMQKTSGPSFAPVVASTLIAKVYSTAYRDDEQALANAALICELVNNLPAIIAALEARPSPATEGEVEALKSCEAWLTSWGAHAGDCRGWRSDDACTCGLVAVRHEARAALSAARPSREGEMRALLEKVRTFLSVEYALPEIEAGHDGHPVDKAARKLWDEIHGTLQQQKEG